MDRESRSNGCPSDVLSRKERGTLLREIRRDWDKYGDCLFSFRYHAISTGSLLHAIKYVVERDQRGCWEDYIVRNVPDMRIEWARSLLTMSESGKSIFIKRIERVEARKRFESTDEEIESILNNIITLYSLHDEVVSLTRIRESVILGEQLGRLLQELKQGCGMTWKEYLNRRLIMRTDHAEALIECYGNPLTADLPGLPSYALATYRNIWKD